MIGNECVPYYDPDHCPTAKASAAVTGKRFVDITGGLSTDGNITCGPATAKGKALGVADKDTAEGKRFVVLRKRVVPVTASGTIEPGEEVEVAAGGKAAKKNEGIAVGRAWAKATDGTDCKVALYV